MEYTEVKNLDQATAVTVGEVRAAVINVALEHFEDATGSEVDVLATDVIRSIFNSRERDWKVRDLAEDANGFIWQRWSGSQWKKMGYGGVFPHQTPARPLTLIRSPQDESDESRHLARLERARDDGAPI
jgi:hypothetical protein